MDDYTAGWFARLGDAKIEAGRTPYSEFITVEELYQRFKNRLLAEMVKDTEKPGGSAD